MANTNINLPEKIGKYQIIEILGHGGMGVVYRGRNPETGQAVAIKTVRLINTRHSEMIRREIRALARIIHPGIVQILDEGIEDSSPWYAMKLLDGVTLRQFGAQFIWGETDISTEWASMTPGKVMRDDPDSPGIHSSWWTQIFGSTLDADEIPEVMLPEAAVPDHHADADPVIPAAGGYLEDVLDLMLALCQSLAYLHGKGIVHGDLKPENIQVRPDGLPVILDFGLVTQIWPEISREELASGSLHGGTLGYMAPEQIQGELVDARTDLFSLGCIFYEIITGHIPFTGSRTSELIISKLKRSPIPLSARVSGLPKNLETLILQLLEKDPRRRISHADILAAELIRLGATENKWEKLPAPEAYLYRPRFVGRENELDTLESHIHQLEAGTGGLVMLGGETGIGKTRILMRVTQLARKRNLLVLTSDSRQSEGLDSSVKEPLNGLRNPLRLIAEHCRQRGTERIKKVIGHRGVVFARYAPIIRHLEGQQNLPEPQELPGDAGRLRLFTYLAESLAELSEEAPVMLVLDSLEFADELTLGLIEFLHRAGRLSRFPILIIGAFRSEETGEQLHRLLKNTGSTVLSMESLNDSDMGKIIMDMTGASKPPTVFTRFLTQYAEGNPFFVSEYLRTAVHEKVMFRNPGGYWEITAEHEGGATETDFENLPIPRALEALLNRRVNRLSAKARELLDIASIIGNRIPILILWHLIPYSDDVLDAIDELIRARVLFEPVPGTLQFVHDRLRVFTYQITSTTDRRSYHRTIAEILESDFAESPVEYESSLAHHWDQSGETTKAAEYYLKIARRAEKENALEEAAEAYEAALCRMERTAPITLDVHLEYVASVLSIQGKMDLGEKHLNFVLDTSIGSDVGVHEGKALRGLALIKLRRGQPRTALDLCNKALKYFRNLNNMENEAATLTSIASIYFNMGDLKSAHNTHQKAMAIYKHLQNRRAIATTMTHIAPIYCIQGDLERGRETFLKALEFHRELGDQQFQGITLGNLGNIENYYGNYQKSCEYYRKALRIAREIGDRKNESIMLVNLAIASSALSDLRGAMNWYQDAIVIQREIQDRQMEGFTLANMAVIYRDQGDVAKALSLFNQALLIHREVGDRQREGETLRNLAKFYRLIRGEYTQAEKYLRESTVIFESMGNQFGVLLSECEAGKLALARNKSAQKHLDHLKTVIEKSDAGMEGQIGFYYRQLQKDEESFQTNQPLFHGEAPETITPKLRDMLINP